MILVTKVKNKEIEDEEEENRKRKNIFKTDNKISLKSLIRKNEEVYEDDNSGARTPGFKQNHSKGYYQEDIIEELNEEDSIDPGEELSQKILKSIYNGIVDQMIFSIINSSFVDIRIQTNLDSFAEGIIERTIKNLTIQVAESTLVYAQEEEECRLREIKAYEDKLQADKEKRELEIKEKLRLQKTAKEQTDLEIYKVYDQMLFDYLYSLSKNCIFSERERNNKLTDIT